MSEAVSIIYAGRNYSAHARNGSVSTRAGQNSALQPTEEGARRWLSDQGLKKSKAKKLLAAALRSEGELADESHPLRAAARSPAPSSARL